MTSVGESLGGSKFETKLGPAMSSTMLANRRSSVQ